MSRGGPVSSVTEQARTFAAFVEGTRFLLSSSLGPGSRSITELTVGLALTRRAVTERFHVLEEAEVVAGTKIGRERRFSLEGGTWSAPRATSNPSRRNEMRRWVVWSALAKQTILSSCSSRPTPQREKHRCLACLARSPGDEGLLLHSGRWA